MSLEVFAALLDGHRFLPRATRPLRAAFEVLPELADGLPALVADVRGIHLLSSCADVLRPLCEAVVNEAAYGGAPDDVDALERRLASDPLVSLLVGLSQEGAAVSPAAAAVPFLQVLAHTASLVEVPSGDAEAAADHLARVAVAVLSRLGAACARMEAAGKRVPALAEACASARAAALFPRGTLDRDPALPLLCGVLGAQVPPAVAEAAMRAVPVALAGVISRRDTGAATGDDAVVLFRHLPPGLADDGPSAAADALSYDPAALALILPALSRYTDVEALTAAGIDADMARRLMDPSTGLAAAAALGDALSELQRWDVLSLLCNALSAPSDGRRGLVVPRGAPGWGTAVAVGLGRLRADITRRGLDPGALSAIDAAWQEATRGVPALCTDLGHVGLLVFDDALEAFRFSLTVGARMGANLAVGVGHGYVLGGTDGNRSHVYGAAVDAALRWVATGPLPTRAGGFGVQLLGHHGGWLCGSGVAIDGGAVDAIEEARVRHGVASRDDGAPGGDSRMPKGLDLNRVFMMDGAVVALARVSGVTGGYEAIAMTLDEWRTLVEREVAVSPTPVTTQVEEDVRPESSVPSRPPSDEGRWQEGWDEPEADLPSTIAPPVLDLEEPPVAPTTQGYLQPPPPTTEAEPQGYLPPPTTEAEPQGYLPPPAAPEPQDDREPRATAPEPQGYLPPPAASAPPAPSEPSVTVPPQEPTEPQGYLPGPAEPSGLLGAETAAPAVQSTADHGVMSEPERGSTLDAQRPVALARAAYELEILDDDPDPATFHTSGEMAAVYRTDAPPSSQASADAPPARAEDGRARPGDVPPPPALDFKYLLGNYAHVRDASTIAFGRVLAGRMIDRHAYPWQGDLDAAYVAFLRDKVSAGFVPRLELTGEVPAGAVPEALDLERLGRAWAEVG